MFNKLGLKYKFVILSIATIVIVTATGLVLFDYLVSRDPARWLQYSLILAAFYVGTGVIGVFLFSRYMIRPVLNLTEKVNQVRQGNLDIPFDEIPRHKRVDEMDKLFEGFGHMLRHLRQTIDELTDSKEKAEAATRELDKSKKKLEAIFNGISDGIMIIDRGFKIASANPTMLRLMDVSEEEALGESCFLLCNGKPSRCSFCKAGEVFKTGQHLSTFCKKTDKSACKDRVYEIHDFPLYDDHGNIEQVIEYVKDVTEAIEMQTHLEDSRRLAAIGEMAAKVAHEVRNPLNAIKGATHYLQSEIKEKESGSYLTLIEEQVDRVNRVATELLFFTKPKKIMRQACRITDIVENALRVTRPQITTKEITVETSGLDEAPAVHLDAGQMEQALINLIANSVDAMESGGHLHIHLKNDGKGLRLTVADNGCGIPEQNTKNLFVPFYTTKTKGTGLGLTIVKKIVENHSGSLQIKSKPNEGTEVSIILPLEKSLV